MNDTNLKFGATIDKLREAQTRLKEKNKEVDLDPENRIKKTELEISKMINESNKLCSQNNMKEALDVAKEISIKMRSFEKYLEANSLNEFLNLDLMLSVSLNLARMYEQNEMYTEALSEYSKMINAKQHENGFLIRVNMGNIYFLQEKFQLALKMYKMALDMTSQKINGVRMRILKSIGHTHVKLQEYNEAILCYEEIQQKFPDLETGFNLILCLFSINDKDRMKKTFCELLQIQSFWSLKEDKGTVVSENGIKDPLSLEITARKNKYHKLISDSAKLIAPVISETTIEGFNWIIEMLGNQGHLEIQSEILIEKALAHAKLKQIDDSIKILESFEKGGNERIMTIASTNLSYLYFLKHNIEKSERYCDMALIADRYNSKALVNKGNCHFYRNDYIKAKESYLEAIGVEADCIEALYNLAFVNKRMNNFLEAISALEKLQSILPNYPEVIFQMASIYELMGDHRNAIKWYDLLLNYVPNEPNINSKLGFLYFIENDETQAFQHYLNSFKILPNNLDTIGWLGISYVKTNNYERACYFFERASFIQPKEVKWRLLMASCYRRMGASEKALDLYEQVHNEDEENLESLRFLVQISSELGKNCDLYLSRLKKLERELEVREGGFVEIQSDHMDNKIKGNAASNNMSIKNDELDNLPKNKPKLNENLDFENENIDNILPD